MVDGRGTVRLADEVAAKSLGCERDELRGLNVADLLVPLDELIAGLGNGLQSDFCRRGDGSEVQITYSVSAVHAAEGPDDGLYAVQFRVEFPLHDTAAGRNRLRRLASIGAAAPAMIDDVKSSLAAITLGLELLEEQASSSELRGQTAALLAEARRGVAALDGFGATGDDLRTSFPTDLGPMLGDARSAATTYGEARGVRLSWGTDDLPPLPLDPAVAYAIVLRLVTRAADACEPGDVVAVEATLEEGEFVLTVVDTGSPMSSQAAREFTEPLLASSNQGQGAGLGSYVAGIEAAGGTLEVEDRKDGGTRVTLRVPVQVAQAVDALPFVGTTHR